MSQPPKLKTNNDVHRTAAAATVSIAIPGSFVSNAQTRELQTQLAGQIARACAVYRIDEVVVYDDGLGTALNASSNYRRGRPPPPPSSSSTVMTTATGGEEEETKDGDDDDDGGGNGGKTGDSGPGGEERRRRHRGGEEERHRSATTDPHAFLARILQYVECPQYLRRRLFPMHPDLQFAGLLPPLDAPHHLRRGDVSRYREGVVVDDGRSKKENDDGLGDGDGGGGGRGGGGTVVVCGVPNRMERSEPA
jgi:predicted SPOUT superfamily RNA methylase MTH1